MIPAFLPVQDVVELDAVFVDIGANGEEIPPRDAYRAGHVPGAVFVDLDRWLAAPSSHKAGRHPLPDAETFAEGMRRAGISESDVVVAYDRVGGVFAARIVWMLRAVGMDAALLDGGLPVWPGQLEQGEVVRQRSLFAARAIPRDHVADFDEVTRLTEQCEAGGNPDHVLIDAREAHRYRGEPHPLDAVSGHIPGARSLPCREHLEPDGCLLPRDVLRARFAAVGIDSADISVISSCGSGVTACHNLLVLEHARLGTGRLYPGSWSQWSESGRPITVGSDPC